MNELILPCDIQLVSDGNHIWNDLDIPELPRNEGYDNHNSDDVLTRLQALIEE